MRTMKSSNSIGKSANMFFTISSSTFNCHRSFGSVNRGARIWWRTILSTSSRATIDTWFSPSLYRLTTEHSSCQIGSKGNVAFCLRIRSTSLDGGNFITPWNCCVSKCRVPTYACCRIHPSFCSCQRIRPFQFCWKRRQRWHWDRSKNRARSPEGEKCSSWWIRTNKNSCLIQLLRPIHFISPSKFSRKNSINPIIATSLKRSSRYLRWSFATNCRLILNWFLWPTPYPSNTFRLGCAWRSTPSPSLWSPFP